VLVPVVPARSVSPGRPVTMMPLLPVVGLGRGSTSGHRASGQNAGEDSEAESTTHGLSPRDGGARGGGGAALDRDGHATDDPTGDGDGARCANALSAYASSVGHRGHSGAGCGNAAARSSRTAD